MTLVAAGIVGQVLAVLVLALLVTRDPDRIEVLRVRVDGRQEPTREPTPDVPAAWVLGLAAALFVVSMAVTLAGFGYL